ncbi:chemotaxis protein CheA [Cytobacillus purgationiresistens]|uniref:Chemotaxis protein CheA n=1 Tax=Cytobacillus purgationiresistens TaxID=863449 RepID=A0ABU0AG33_9BACI|nr:chemotaxis protein CheA [Cytobacillus purgationiresistens]MDQ0270208.1 two-component system chemotaxis sensor kinase CheA [Cytobacillus purgationiresistens]
MEMSQYLEVFIEESKEHLQACNQLLLDLEKNPTDLKIVNDIFRSAHTLKGMSATMGYEDLASLTHQMENVLDAIRNQKIIVDTNVLDVVFQSVDDLEAMVESIANGGDGKRDVSNVVTKLKMIEDGESPVQVDQTAATLEELKPSSGASQPNVLYDDYEMTIIMQSKELGYEAYEMTITLREDCLLKAARVFMIFEVLEKNGEIVKAMPSTVQLEEEDFDQSFAVTMITNENIDMIKGQVLKVSEVESVMISTVQNQGSSSSSDSEWDEPQLPDELKTLSGPAISEKDNDAKPVKPQNNKTIRVNIERLDILMNLFEELVIDRGRLAQISQDMDNQELQETVEHMSRISSDLQNIILNMRMVPVETVFNRFPRMVRQLARDLNKKVDLEIIGAETELDRTVIDEIGDPLVHLLRNALDHGIETPEERRLNGKPEAGTVVLKAFHSGNHVFIEIEDDGSGINKDNVLRKAMKKGIINEHEMINLSEQEIYQLIFSSGFSTADRISDVSGRGVGLDVVKSTIESLGGSVSIDSQEGKGSIFSIQLPLTLSIISAMLVEIQSEKYAIPLSSIIETAIVKKADVMHTHNQQVIDFRGKVVPLLYLKDIFEIETSYPEDDNVLSVVIVRKGEKMAGIVVNSFIGQQEIVLKSLGDYLANVFAISGATILGDGQVALILDCNALIK